MRLTSLVLASALLPTEFTVTVVAAVTTALSLGGGLGLIGRKFLGGLLGAAAAVVFVIAASSMGNDMATYLLGLKYIEALPQIAQGKGTSIFLPSEATGVLGAIGGIKEMLRGAGGIAGAPAAPARTPPGVGPFSGPSDN